MCFSPEASFGASAVLMAVGIVAVRKTKEPAAIPMSVIPVIFSVQQLAEGFLWLSLRNGAGDLMDNIWAYSFLFFAHVAWPAWVPFAVYRIEKDPYRKKIVGIFLFLGVLVAVYLGYLLVTNPITPQITGHHLSYLRMFPDPLIPYTAMLYLIATVAPCFASRRRFVWILGAALLISFALTSWMYQEHVISVWCFFAALISGIVLLIVKK